MRLISKNTNLDLLNKSKLIDKNYYNKELVKHEVVPARRIEHHFLSNPELWNKSISVYFNGLYYLSKYPDLRNLDGPPVLHYIRHGFKEGRSASVLIDLKYIAYQVYKLKRPVDVTHSDLVRLVSDYTDIQELLRSTNVDPNPLFCNEYFVEKNEVDLEKLTPIEFYFRHNGINPASGQELETNPFFSFNEYAIYNSDVKSSPFSMLEHLLFYGLKEERIKKIPGLIDDLYVNAASDLYLHKDAGFFSTITNLDPKKVMLGPNWDITRYIDSTAAEVDISDRKIAFGIVLYNNSKEELTKLLSSIEKEIERNKIKEYQIAFWINDNHSEEHYSFLKSAKLLGIGQGNIGFGNAHNKLMEILFTEYDYYFGLNPDGYLMKGALRESTNLCINRDDNAFIELASFPVEHPKWYDPNNLDTLWVSGAAFLMSKKIWNEVGAFDPELHMYCEDVDLSWKIKASGFELKVCPSAKFFHDVTSRHFDAESIERERGRAKIMLQGAYYLCAKWGGQELLDVVKNQLKSEFNVSEKELQKPSRLIPSDIADEVTDFRHGLRFSPSRFWE